MILQLVVNMEISIMIMIINLFIYVLIIKRKLQFMNKLMLMVFIVEIVVLQKDLNVKIKKLDQNILWILIQLKILNNILIKL